MSGSTKEKYDKETKEKIMVNLELYRVFYTVAKCGSLTRAAEELYISQPAVSQSIKQLENQLGISLFNRTHRGMELSEQGGKLIFASVEEALKLFDEAEKYISFDHHDSEVYRNGAGVCVYFRKRLSGRFDRNTSGNTLRRLYVDGTGTFVPKKNCGG
mgnify:CR=1 FL=1